MVSCPSNPKERQYQRMFKLPHNNTDFICQQGNAQNPSRHTSTVCELRTSNVQAGCRKGRRTRYQISNIHWITEKARELQKNINFCFIDYAKAFHCVDHNKLWKILKEMGIPENPTWSCETCMQVKKQELKPDKEQWTHSKYRKFYIKAVYHHPAYLTYTHNTPYRMPSWMKLKLESILPREISITHHHPVAQLWRPVHRLQLYR